MLLSQPSIARCIDGFGLFRAGIRVTVRLNCQRMLYGRLMLVHVPYGGLCDTQTDVGLYSGYPHALISATTNATESMDAQFIMPNLAYNLVAGGTQVGTYYLVVLAPLTACSSEPGTTCTYTVDASFLDPQLYANNGLTLVSALHRVVDVDIEDAVGKRPARKLVTRAQMYSAKAAAKHVGGGALASLKDSTKQNLEAVKKAAADQTASAPPAPSTGGVFSWPIVGPLLQVGETILGGAGRMFSSVVSGGLASAAAGALGLDKPTSVAVTTITRSAYLSDLTSVDTIDHSVPLMYHLGNKIDPLPSLGGSTADEMSIDYIKGVPSIAMSVPYAAGASPLYIQLDPNFVGSQFVSGTGASAMWRPTILGALTLKYQQWRGDLKLYFDICSCPFMTGRLRFRVFPNAVVSGATVLTYPQDVWTRIVDIQSETRLSFQVPFLCDTLWKPTSTSYSVLGTGAGSSGTLVIDWYNDLTCPDPTNDAPVFVTMYMAGANNFDLALPINYEMLSFSNWSVALSKSDSAVVPRQETRAQLDVRGYFCDAFEPIHPTAVESTVVGLQFGERVQTIADFLHLYAPVGTVQFATTAPAYVAFTENYQGIYAGLPCPIAFNYTGGATSTLYTHPICGWSQLFSFARGSMRYKIENSNALTGNQMFAWLSNAVSGAWAARPYRQVPLALARNSVMPTLEVMHPYNCIRMFDTLNATTAGGNRPHITQVNVQCLTESGSQLTIYAAAGDDFRLMGLHGPPMLMQNGYATGDGQNVIVPFCT
jgi:hypothetical protein